MEQLGHRIILRIPVADFLLFQELIWSSCMKACWVLSGFIFLCLAPLLLAEEAKKPKTLGTYQIPYRLSETKHVIVRAKINGKGPYNFIVDTVCWFSLIWKNALVELAGKK